MKWIGIIFKSIFGFVFFLIGIVFVILVWPQIIINEHNLKWATNLARNSGVIIDWKELEVQVDSLALLRKRIAIRANKLCFDLNKQKVSGCADYFEFSVAGSFAKFIPKLVELGPIEIQNLKWKMGEEGKKIQGDLNLKGREREETEFPRFGSWAFDLWGGARLPDRSQAKIQSFLQVNGTDISTLNLNYTIHSAFIRNHGKALAQLEGSASWNHVHALVNAQASNLVPKVPKISIKDCDLKLQKGVVESQFNSQCPVRLKIPIPPEAFQGVKVPTDVGAIIQTQLGLSDFIPNAQTRIQGTAKLTVEPILTPLFLGKAELNSKVNGIISEFPQQGTLESDVAISLTVFRFENLVKDLRHGAWAVPAPLHVLKGSFGITVEGHSSLKEGSFPIALKSRLASKAQSFDLDGNGAISFVQEANDFKPHLAFDLVLTDVQLVLPRLDLGAPPRLFPDPRIKVPEPKKEDKKPSSFEYEISIRTPPDNPVRILTNLTKSPVPIALNLKLSHTQPIQGKVEILTFPVEMFRRTATIDHLSLNLIQPMDESKLDGAVHVDYADYDITIHLNGNIAEPFIHLTSDPPLPENQLIATLLFGQPLEQLDPMQSESVGNTKAAFAQGAVGLTSLYVLASTPIQSVAYDPSTKSVTAKVRLSDGTSLNVGTETGAPTVGLRKRLGPSWTISTDITNPSGTTSSNYADIRSGGGVSAYLEWSRRY